MLSLITKKGSLLKGSRVALRVMREKNRQTHTQKNAAKKGRKTRNFLKISQITD